MLHGIAFKVARFYRALLRSGDFSARRSGGRVYNGLVDLAYYRYGRST